MFKVQDATDVVLVSLLLTWTYFTPCSSVSIVNFEQVNTNWTAIMSTFSYLKQQLWKKNCTKKYPVRGWKILTKGSFLFSVFKKRNSLGVILNADRSVWPSKQTHSSTEVVLHNLSSYQSNIEFWFLVVDIDYQERMNLV